MESVNLKTLKSYGKAVNLERFKNKYKELIKKIRQIEIKSNKLVDEIFSGEYHTRFKGKGMEFEDIRAYYHGDDVRNIDWNVSARHGETYVKQFNEERELNMFLLVDMSHSNDFGAKRHYIAELGATLSYSANRNNDKVGMILFTDKVEKVIPSMSGKRHTLAIIETILDFRPEHKGTDIMNVLRYFNKIQKKRSIVFLISDFMDEGYEQALGLVRKKHDLVLIRVLDPGEEHIPPGAIYTFEDLETGETFVLDHLKGDKSLEETLVVKAPDLITLRTDEDYIKPLKLFFHRRLRG